MLILVQEMVQVRIGGQRTSSSRTTWNPYGGLERAFSARRAIGEVIIDEIKLTRVSPIRILAIFDFMNFCALSVGRWFQRTCYQRMPSRPAGT